MDDLRAQLESGERSAIVQFDGSSDILVTHSIMELLDRAVGVHGERVLLILDEYHMLNEAHKGQLFDWIEGKAASLQVVLIANRIDFKDRERVKGCAVNVKLLETRLSLAVLEEKLGSSGVAEEERRKVRMWFVTSRLVFGEEAISLRLVDPIVAAPTALSTAEAQGDTARQIAHDLLDLGGPFRCCISCSSKWQHICRWFLCNTV